MPASSPGKGLRVQSHTQKNTKMNYTGHIGGEAFQTVNHTVCKPEIITN